MAQASEKKRLNILRNELAWVQRGARARSTKQKARLQRFEELKNVKGPVTDGKVELTSAASRLGRTTVEIENVSKSYGDKVLIRDFTYLFGKDDRVGFIGPNGSGKTTLMKMILGEVAPDSGHIEIGQTVKLGYYAQEIDDTMMHPEQRVIDYIRDVAEYITTEDGQITAARMLERFLFSGEDQYGQLGKLSGGERRRLQLCKVLMGAPNVLILDEPTNDLDIATCRYWRIIWIPSQASSSSCPMTGIFWIVWSAGSSPWRIPAWCSMRAVTQIMPIGKLRRGTQRAQERRQHPSRRTPMRKLLLKTGKTDRNAN